jgi:hypothetical protein
VSGAPDHDWKQIAWEIDADFFECRRCHLEIPGRREFLPSSEEDCRLKGVPVCRTIEELIARSSLGTTEAKAIRGRTPPEVTARVLQRSDEISRKKVTH